MDLQVFLEGTIYIVSFLLGIIVLKSFYFSRHSFWFVLVIFLCSGLLNRLICSINWLNRTFDISVIHLPFANDLVSLPTLVFNIQFCAIVVTLSKQTLKSPTKQVFYTAWVISSSLIAFFARNHVTLCPIKNLMGDTKNIFNVKAFLNLLEESLRRIFEFLCLNSHHALLVVLEYILIYVPSIVIAYPGLITILRKGTNINVRFNVISMHSNFKYISV